MTKDTVNPEILAVKKFGDFTPNRALEIFAKGTRSE